MTTPNIIRPSSKGSRLLRAAVDQQVYSKCIIVFPSYLDSCSSLSLLHAVSSQIWFEFSLSTSLSRAFGLQVTQVTRTPSRQPRLELQIRVRVKWGQRLCAGCWQSLSAEALWGSWRAASCLSLTAILLALRAQLQVTALTGFVPTLLGKIRPLPYKKPNMSDWAAYVSGVINSTCESCNYQWKNQSTPASVILAT